MSSVCTWCGHENHSGDKFCGDCGHALFLQSDSGGKEVALPELSWDEKLAKIQRYLPKGLAAKILSQKDKIEGERKQVSVLFCDMAGSTAIGESLGQEDVYFLMEEIFETLIQQVHAYEGTVNKMTGDGIMALFGAPIALEDAPQRAVRSGLAIAKEMEILSRRLERERGFPPFQMRIGIHTGMVVVGSLGNDLRVEFNAVGDTVNLASRMENLAAPGTILVSEETYRLTEGLFWFEFLGEKKVKGKAKPVKTYQVLAPKPFKTRFEVSEERGLTRFIGRKREVELLLEGFERLKEGRGQVFSIVAEAGVGKSRLVHEFRKALAGREFAFVEGKCVSYGRGMAYHPVIEIVKSIFQIHVGDGEQEIKRKAQEGLRSLQGEEGVHLPYLLELLSVRESGSEKILTHPDTRRNRIMETFKWITLRKSEALPLVVVWEDLHWMDRSSEDTLKSFLESVPGSRVLVILTYRPDFAPLWGPRSYHSQITVSRLSTRQSLSMIGNLVGESRLSRELEEIILRKTEGVPLFIEEFIRSFKDLRIMIKKNHHYTLAKGAQAVSVPSTIQEVIMARVDSLPEGARELLQIASVIDREFSHELIRRSTGLPEQELLSRLSILKEAELLYEKGVVPHNTYFFKHSLTREVVYESLLSKRKRQLHHDIGKAIEELYRNSLGEYTGVLTDHCIKSEEFEKAAEFARLAGKRARHRSAYADAISHTYKELFCLEKLPESEAVQKRIIDVRVALANYCMNLNEHVEAYEAVTPISDLALKINYRKGLPSIYTALGSYLLFVEEDHRQGSEYLHQAIEFALEGNDLFSLWNASYLLGTTLCWNCEFEEARGHFQKCLDLSLAAHNAAGISAAKINLGVKSLFQGNIAHAYEISLDALATAEESGDIYVQGMAHSYHGTACYYRGLFTEAEDHLLKGISFGEKTTHFTWGSWASAFLGDLYFDLGEYERSWRAYNRAFSFLEKRRFGPSWINLILVAMARAKVMKGESNVDLSQTMNFFSRNRNRGFRGWIAEYIAEILFHLGGPRLAEAHTWVERAIQLNRENGMQLLLARDYVLAARILEKMGEAARGRDLMSQGIEIFKDCGAVEYWSRGGRVGPASGQ